MTTDQASPALHPEMDKWLEEAVGFLAHKTPEELRDMYVLLNKVDTGDMINNRFSMAMELRLKSNEADAIEVAYLLLDEEEPRLRLEVCFVLHGIMFTNEEAMKIVFEKVLCDPDESVSKQAYTIVSEDFEGIEDVPLWDILRVAEYLLEAEARQNATQSPR